MSLSTTLLLLGSATISFTFPLHPAPRAAIPSFPAGTSWDILLTTTDSGTDSIAAVPEENFQVIDIDLFDTSKEAIAEFKATGKRVICYFSAGTREAWRSDAKKFKSGDTGNSVSGGPNGDWPDELWVDVTSANVKAVMEARIELAKEKGCDAVDPDNVDGFDNDTSFSHAKSAYTSYIRFLSETAHSANIAIGLKNAVDMIPDVIDAVDFAVNEQCHEYSECAKYKPFTAQNKAIFNIEYGGNACKKAAVNGVKMSTLVKSEDQNLDALGGACQSSGSPTVVQPVTPTPAAPTPVTPTPVSSTAPQQPAASSPPPADEGENGEETGEGNEEEEEEEEEDVPSPTPSTRPAPTRRPFRWNWWGHRHPSN
ncbi:glycoside hydrolase family 114 protein [Sporormia fimetaria CBS 119925]|uniref:alpha-galactosidase n=1 Tax=Sporormia fimetaria CBS 119925 TaxID=1340428 RepID=A0A6A6VQV9_9PLEO|nr:glycoside hydrolase family 114 protein [Sporormia fimetaria CBS 119925]